MAGLTESFKPFIMGIEANGNNLPKDAIIAKLLDSGNHDEKNSAFYGKQNKPKNNSHKCYNCNSISHLANECDKKNKNTTFKKKGKKRPEKKDEYAFMMGLLTVKNNDEWYIDSGASSHI